MDTSEQVAQLAVTAWEQAVNGDGALLASLADADVVDRLLRDPERAERGGYRIDPDRDVAFVGSMSLARAGSGTGPWRLTSGSVQTLDDYLGYVFTYRAEGGPGYVPRFPAGGGSGSWPASPSPTRSSGRTVRSR